MMHTTETLYHELMVTQMEINKQIEAVKSRVLQTFPDSETPMPDDVYRMQNRDGSFVLTDLLAAKAQLLSGMAALKAADVSSKAQQRPRR